MANTYYNTYSLIIVSEQRQVIGITPASTHVPISKEGFTDIIKIAEDGTLWALSHPNKEDGGSKIYYSQSPNEWHEMTSFPGAFSLAGGYYGNCFFTDSDGSLYIGQTNGTSGKYFGGRNVLEVGAGGGKLWVVYTANDGGGIPQLHVSNWSPPFNFSEFDIGERATPLSLSVNYKGDCYAVEDSKPVYYSHDGHTIGSAGTGGDGHTEQISFKKYNFILSSDDANENGNEVMQGDESGGAYTNMGIRAIKVLSTYYNSAG